MLTGCMLAVAGVLDNEDPSQLRWHDPIDRSRADAARMQLLHALEALRE